jgi:hypothetical protein
MFQLISNFSYKLIGDVDSITDMFFFVVYFEDILKQQSCIFLQLHNCVPFLTVFVDCFDRILCKAFLDELDLMLGESRSQICAVLYQAAIDAIDGLAKMRWMSGFDGRLQNLMADENEFECQFFLKEG